MYSITYSYNHISSNVVSSILVLLDMLVVVSCEIVALCLTTVNPSFCRGYISSACLSLDPGHLGSRRWNPFGTLSRVNVFNIHGVNLLQRPTLSFHYKEVHKKTCCYVASGEDVAISEVDGPSDERRKEGDEEIPGPVAGRGN